MLTICCTLKSRIERHSRPSVPVTGTCCRDTMHPCDKPEFSARGSITFGQWNGIWINTRKLRVITNVPERNHLPNKTEFSLGESALRPIRCSFSRIHWNTKSTKEMKVICDSIVIACPLNSLSDHMSANRVSSTPNWADKVLIWWKSYRATQTTSDCAPSRPTLAFHRWHSNFGSARHSSVSAVERTNGRGKGDYFKFDQWFWVKFTWGMTWPGNRGSLELFNILRFTCSRLWEKKITSKRQNCWMNLLIK